MGLTLLGVPVYALWRRTGARRRRPAGPDVAADVTGSPAEPLL
jgi:hypothetical protein